MCSLDESPMDLAPMLPTMAQAPVARVITNMARNGASVLLRSLISSTTRSDGAATSVTAIGTTALRRRYTLVVEYLAVVALGMVSAMVV
uniref:Uncharacterized protein n=1 Tax=Arundo donax TaxID=35708 RepID=A0A0A8XSB5_ARUDO